MSRYKVTVNGKSYDVVIENAAGVAAAPAAVTTAPVSQPDAPAVETPQAATAPKVEASVAAPVEAPAGAETIASPMPGKILRVLVAKGDSVTVGQNLMILEAMKMENEIPCDREGTVLDIRVSEGASVDTGDALIVIG